MSQVGAREPSDARSAQPPIDWAVELDRHRRWLRTVLYARLGDEQAVDDVWQEVALAAISQRAPLVEPVKVAPWLYRVAVTQSLLYRRKLGRTRKLGQRYAARGLPPVEGAAADPLDWLLADERRSLIRRGLAEIPRRDAELLLLKYTENWSYHELAARLDISHSALEARLHRARGRLRERLAELNVIEVAP